MSRRTLLMGFAAVGLIILILFGPSSFLKRYNREPILIESYASSAEMSIEDLIVQADLIVIGKFSTAHTARWSTPDGKLPEPATIETISRQRLTIFADSDFRVSQFLKGDVEDHTVRVRTFGGQVGQDRMIVVGEPSYKINQRYLLFLFRNTGKTADIEPGSFYGVGSPYEIVNGNAISADGERLLEDLIAYIEKTLTTEPSMPVETPAVIDIPTETSLPTELPITEIPELQDDPTATP